MYHKTTSSCSNTCCLKSLLKIVLVAMRRVLVREIDIASERSDEQGELSNIHENRSAAGREGVEV